MNLHENKELFEQAVRFTAQEMRIPEIYIEKDYWITYVLHTLFQSHATEYTVFKGGTALSKCYKLIDRFSEDLDFVVLKSPEESLNQLTKKIKEITKIVTKVLPEVQVDEVTTKKGMNRKTAHTYSKQFDEEYGQVRDVIVIEATWYGCFEPYEKKEVTTYIYDMMVQTGQHEIGKEYGLLPFEVNVLSLNRTICEKIMSLVRFSYSANPIDDLKMKVRHLYDLHKILMKDTSKAYFMSKDFDAMLQKVGRDDYECFKNNNKWLLNHPAQALLFAKSDEVWNEMKKTYTAVFSNLVYGTLPETDEILLTIQDIRNRIEHVEWNISL